MILIEVSKYLEQTAGDIEVACLVPPWLSLLFLCVGPSMERNVWAQSGDKQEQEENLMESRARSRGMNEQVKTNTVDRMMSGRRF
jgi:hypothetical protein